MKTMISCQSVVKHLEKYLKNYKPNYQKMEFISSSDLNGSLETLGQIATKVSK